jgi:hypothetical protein
MGCGEEILPDHPASFHREIPIFDFKMYSAQDRIIKLNSSVRCKEENSLIVFQIAKKNRYMPIMLIMIRGTLFHECICLIQEEDRIEMLGDLEYAIKPTL